MPSTVIHSIFYYPASSVLRIVFVSGMVYDYKNVPEHIYTGLKNSGSKGSYFNQHVKPHFTFRKIN